jgi:hypothetical protein
MPEWQKTDVLMICIHQSVFDAKQSFTKIRFRKLEIAEI